jgi:hypothetical protein
LEIEQEFHQKEILEPFSIRRLIMSCKEELQELKEKIEQSKAQSDFYLKRCEMINKTIQKLES